MFETMCDSCHIVPMLVGFVNIFRCVNVVVEY